MKLSLTIVFLLKLLLRLLSITFYLSRASLIVLEVMFLSSLIASSVFQLIFYILFLTKSLPQIMLPLARNYPLACSLLVFLVTGVSLKQVNRSFHLPNLLIQDSYIGRRAIFMLLQLLRMLLKLSLRIFLSSYC